MHSPTTNKLPIIFIGRSTFVVHRWRCHCLTVRDDTVASFGIGVVGGHDPLVAFEASIVGTEPLPKIDRPALLCKPRLGPDADTRDVTGDEISGAQP